jgi:hypothetical protein
MLCEARVETQQESPQKERRGKRDEKGFKGY